jgi:hypothetical protein
VSGHDIDELDDLSICVAARKFNISNNKVSSLEGMKKIPWCSLYTCV